MKTKRATKAEMAARIEKVRELAAQGMSQLTIATVLGMDQSHLSKLMRQNGIEALHGGNKPDEREVVIAMVKAGKSQAEAARIANVSAMSASRWARQAREAAQ